MRNRVRFKFRAIGCQRDGRGEEFAMERTCVAPNVGLRILRPYSPTGDPATGKIGCPNLETHSSQYSTKERMMKHLNNRPCATSFPFTKNNGRITEILCRSAVLGALTVVLLDASPAWA